MLQKFLGGERVKPANRSAGGRVVQEWTSGNTSRVDAALLSADRCGAAFCWFFVNDMGFHVYLRFSSVRWRDTGEIVLWAWQND